MLCLSERLPCSISRATSTRMLGMSTSWGLCGGAAALPELTAPFWIHLLHQGRSVAQTPPRGRAGRGAQLGWGGARGHTVTLGTPRPSRCPLQPTLLLASLRGSGSGHTRRTHAAPGPASFGGEHWSAPWEAGPRSSTEPQGSDERRQRGQLSGVQSPPRPRSVGPRSSC